MQYALRFPTTSSRVLSLGFATILFFSIALDFYFVFPIMEFYRVNFSTLIENWGFYTQIGMWSSEIPGGTGRFFWIFYLDHFIPIACLGLVLSVPLGGCNVAQRMYSLIPLKQIQLPRLVVLILFGLVAFGQFLAICSMLADTFGRIYEPLLGAIAWVMWRLGISFSSWYDIGFVGAEGYFLSLFAQSLIWSRSSVRISAVRTLRSASLAVFLFVGLLFALFHFAWAQFDVTEFQRYLPVVNTITNWDVFVLSATLLLVSASLRPTPDEKVNVTEK